MTHNPPYAGPITHPFIEERCQALIDILLNNTGSNRAPLLSIPGFPHCTFQKPTALEFIKALRVQFSTNALEFLNHCKIKAQSINHPTDCFSFYADMITQTNFLEYPLDKMLAVHFWVNQFLTYDFNNQSPYDLSTSLNAQKGICRHYAQLKYIALLLAGFEPENVCLLVQNAYAPNRDHTTFTKQALHLSVLVNLNGNYWVLNAFNRTNNYHELYYASLAETLAQNTGVCTPSMYNDGIYRLLIGVYGIDGVGFFEAARMLPPTVFNFDQFQPFHNLPPAPAHTPISLCPALLARFNPQPCHALVLQH